jgi:hypothetical protein
MKTALESGVGGYYKQMLYQVGYYAIPAAISSSIWAALEPYSLGVCAAWFSNADWLPTRQAKKSALHL